MNTRTKETENYDIETGEGYTRKCLNFTLKLNQKKMLKLLKKLSTSLGIRTGKKQKTNQQNKEVYPSMTIKDPKIVPIEGTPFATVQKAENEYILVFGQNMITNEIFSSRGAAEKEIERIDWNKILNIIGIIVTNAIKHEQLINKTNE